MLWGWLQPKMCLSDISILFASWGHVSPSRRKTPKILHPYACFECFFCFLLLRELYIHFVLQFCSFSEYLFFGYETKQLLLHFLFTTLLFFSLALFAFHSIWHLLFQFIRTVHEYRPKTVLSAFFPITGILILDDAPFSNAMYVIMYIVNGKDKDTDTNVIVLLPVVWCDILFFFSIVIPISLLNAHTI